jgi:hypothetical protein
MCYFLEVNLITPTGGTAVRRSSRSSIETVADALNDVKDEAWERTFEIAKAHRPTRGGRAKKSIAVLAVLGGVGFVAAKNRHRARSVAKSLKNRF